MKDAFKQAEVAHDHAGVRAWVRPVDGADPLGVRPGWSPLLVSHHATRLLHVRLTGS